MASIGIGDVHGNLHALNDLLAQVESTVTPDDTVVFLGDYIDRGPDSCPVIQRIIHYCQESRASVVTLRGNHEDWLLKTMRDHTHHAWLLATNGYSTIESYSLAASEALREAVRNTDRDALYGGTAALPYDVFFDAMAPAHTTFFEHLKLFHETPDGIFVHAGVDPEVKALELQSSFTLLMGTFYFLHNYCGPPVVVYGHHDNARLEDGWPYPCINPWSIGIDTISHGVLTAVRLPDRKVFQSARHEVRCAKKRQA
jgi:serine/threonine protein phosphatase 1